MTSRDFVLWLNGLFELAPPKTLNKKQTALIRQHLKLVFHHEIDPSYSDDPEVLEERNDIHDGVKPPAITTVVDDPSGHMPFNPSEGPLFKSLTPEELAKIPPITKEQIEELLKEARRRPNPWKSSGGSRTHFPGRISC